jgi:hypothetical protein
MRKLLAVIATLALLLGGAGEASTRTDAGHTPLVVLGIGLLASGVALLRRSAAVPSP